MERGWGEVNSGKVNKYDLDSASVQTVATGAGLIHVPFVFLPQVIVGDVTVTNVPTVVFDFPVPVGGVLGLSFLHHCRFVLDCPARVLGLRGCLKRVEGIAF